MGFYDSFYLTGYRFSIELQTKAFGKGMRDLAIGDEVRLVPAQMDAEEGWEERLTELRDSTSKVLDYQVECHPQGVYIEVKGGRIESISDERDYDVPLFDSHGWPKVTANEKLIRELFEGSTLGEDSPS